MAATEEPIRLDPTLVQPEPAPTATELTPVSADVEEARAPTREPTSPNLSKAVVELARDMSADAADLPKALQARLRFAFLGEDVKCVHGLLDWNATEWSKEFETYPTESKEFLHMLLGEVPMKPDGQIDLELAGQKVKVTCAGMLPHHQWLRIVKFQNDCTLRSRPNARGGASDAERKESYLSNALLSNMLFDRDFPLGVEDCVLDNPYPFAVEHSGLYEVRHKKNRIVNVAVFGLVFGLMLTAVSYMLYLMTAKTSIWAMVRGRTEPPHAVHSSPCALCTTQCTTALPSLIAGHTVCGGRRSRAPCRTRPIPTTW